MFFAYFYDPYENYFSLITTIIYQDAQYVSLTDLLILYIMIPVSKGLIPPVLAHGWGNDLGTRSNSCNYVSIPDKNGESFRGFPFFSFIEQIYSFSDALVIPT